MSVRITLDLHLYGSSPEDPPHWSVGIDANAVTSTYETNELIKLLETLATHLPTMSADETRR
jgi:hypothetical protein